MTRPLPYPILEVRIVEAGGEVNHDLEEGFEIDEEPVAVVRGGPLVDGELEVDELEEILQVGTNACADVVEAVVLLDDAVEAVLGEEPHGFGC